MCGTCDQSHRTFSDRKTRRVRDLSCGDPRVYLGVELRRVCCRNWGTVRPARLSCLADNPFYTKRFAFYIGRRCPSSTLRDAAREQHLHGKTVQALAMAYLRAPLQRAGTPAPRVLGIDEISLRKGHTYRSVVSDLLHSSKSCRTSFRLLRSGQTTLQYCQWVVKLRLTGGSSPKRKRGNRLLDQSLVHRRLSAP